jgi:2-polyprenyl-3-methyl-5-hydroxy-6-metoxy-1,4-benzoquinol methylase
VDQKELYERQVRTEQRALASSEVTGRRETALLNWILASTREFCSRPAICIAELSVGDGQLSRAVVQRIPNALIDCIDISSARLDRCRKMVNATCPQAAERMRFLELNLDTDFERLDRDHYDIVVGIDVLEHVFDPFAFVRHCSELLKPDGLLFLRVPNIAYFKRRFALLLGRLPVTSSWFETPGSLRAWKDRHGWDGGHLHFFTINSLRWLLEDEGLSCISWDDVGARAGSFRRVWPGMLFGNLAIVARKKPHPDAPAC